MKKMSSDVYFEDILWNASSSLFNLSEKLYVAHDNLFGIRKLARLDNEEISTIIRKDFEEFAAKFNKSSIFGADEKSGSGLEWNTAITFLKKYSQHLNTPPIRIWNDFEWAKRDSILAISRFARCLARLYMNYYLFVPDLKGKTIITGLGSRDFFTDLEILRNDIYFAGYYMLGTYAKAGVLLYSLQEKRISRSKEKLKRNKQRRENEVLRVFTRLVNDPSSKKWLPGYTQQKFARMIKKEVDPYLKSQNLCREGIDLPPQNRSSFYVRIRA